jgi:hypothetical protein
MASDLKPAEELVVSADQADVPDGAAVGRHAGRLAGRGERGMISAEWAVGIVAAIAIAGVLIGVVTNGAVKSAILKFILLVIKAFATYMSAL